MFEIKINDKEYKVRFGMNSFVDTDLMDRTRKLFDMFSGKAEGDVASVAKDFFTCTRDLLYFGFMKYNPVETPQEVGDLIDDYIDEKPDERSVMDLFQMIGEELISKGFLGDLMNDIEEEEEIPETPKPKKGKKVLKVVE